MIRGESPARSGIKRTKSALFRYARVASCHDPLSKTYYDRERAEGKLDNTAVMSLDRRQLNVACPMMRTVALHETKVPVAVRQPP